MIVAPSGTYRLQGRVSEADAVGAARVEGATIEVMSGGGAGLRTTTGSSGYYALYGVSGETTLRVTKAGYQPVAQTIEVSSSNQTFDMALPLATPRRDLSGTYTLTLTAASECKGYLPEEVMVRRYSATVTQMGAYVTVSLSGGTFFVGDTVTDHFTGVVEPFLVRFDFWGPDPWDFGPPFEGVVAEQVAAGLFVPIGSVAATGPPHRLEGALQGGLSVYSPAGDLAIQGCFFGQHQLVLER